MHFRISRPFCTAAACLLALLPALAASHTDPRWPVPTAQPWQAADALFHRDPRWRGGDGANSVDLGGGRVLWLFGDSFVSNKVVSSRKEARMINNSLAIQQSYDPVEASFKGYWKTAGELPQAFFQTPNQHWLWPASGVMIGDKLLILLMEIERASEGLGFAFVSSTGLFVENPGQPPDRWRTVPVVMPDDRFQIIYGSGGLSVEQQYLVAISPGAAPGHDAYLLRWQLAEVRRGDLSQPEWHRDHQWVAHQALQQLPPATIPLAETEFTTHFDARQHCFLQLQCSPFRSGRVGIRFARQRPGPWSELRGLFRPPPGAGKTADVFCYAGKAHPELLAAGLPVTYCSNTRNLSQLVSDESIYYPRFLRIDFPERIRTK